jgi:glucose-6-phosphate-specific signal transduction histidine kinase
MEKLSAWLGRATEEGRAVLNSLRTSTTEVNDLADAFRRALEECRIHSSMEVSLQVSGQIQEMHPIVRGQVYRIGYEAIRNASVHSQATQLRVELMRKISASVSVTMAPASIPISCTVASLGTSVCKACASVLPGSWATYRSRAPPVPVRSSPLRFPAGSSIAR